MELEIITNENSILPAAIPGELVSCAVRLTEQGQPVAGVMIRFCMEGDGGELVHPDLSQPYNPIPIRITDLNGEAFVYFRSDGTLRYPTVMASVIGNY